MFSYFPYAGALSSAGGGEPAMDPSLVGIGLAVAPLVFVVIALVSRNPRAPRLILLSMGLLLVLGLSFGLVSPALGAPAGFGVGAALCLALPDIPDQLRRRIVAVALGLPTPRCSSSLRHRPGFSPAPSSRPSWSDSPTSTGPGGPHATLQR